MWPDVTKLKIFIRPGVTDFRKQINGLVLLVQHSMQRNPLDGSLYVFCSKDRKQIKMIYWDYNGFCLFQKRLERDKFPWPDNQNSIDQLTTEELSMIFSGIDFRKRFQVLNYQRA